MLKRSCEIERSFSKRVFGVSFAATSHVNAPSSICRRLFEFLKLCVGLLVIFPPIIRVFLFGAVGQSRFYAIYDASVKDGGNLLGAFGPGRVRLIRQDGAQLDLREGSWCHIRSLERVAASVHAIIVTEHTIWGSSAC